MIPSKKTEVEFDLNKYNLLIYGQPKIGKSTFASQFDDMLFIPTEPGLNSLSVYKATEKDYISTWSEFTRIVTELKEASDKGELKFKMSCIDTVDNLYDMCLEHVCKNSEPKMEHPSDGAFGKGWALVNTEFKTWILRLASITKVMFISHAKDVEVEIKRIKSSRTQPTISGKSGEFVMGLVDMIGYICNDVGSDNRIIHFIGHDGLVAGDRTNRMGRTVEFDYKKIKERFEKGVKSGKD